MDTQTTAPLIDPRLCPLCGQPNGCAMQQQRDSGEAQPPCWCTRASFAPALLARVPDAARRRACICAVCAGAAKEQTR